MTTKDKEKIQELIDKIRNIHSDCCELISKGIVVDWSLDICSLDEIVNVLESRLSE